MFASINRILANCLQTAVAIVAALVRLFSVGQAVRSIFCFDAKRKLEKIRKIEIVKIRIESLLKLTCGCFLHYGATNYNVTNNKVKSNV